MKTVLSLTYLFLIVFLICLSTSYAEYEVHTQWALPEGAKARLGKGELRSLTYSSDGAHLALGTSIGIWIIDVQTGKECALLTGHTDDVLNLAYSPDNKTLASMSHKEVLLWNVATSEPLGRLNMDGTPSSVAYSPDGKTLAIGNEEASVALVDVDTGPSTLLVEQCHASEFGILVEYSPDSKTFASGSRGGTVVLWDADMGIRKATLIRDSNKVAVFSVAYSPDGKTLATMSSDSTVRLWDADTGEHKATLTGHSSKTVKESPEDNNRVPSVVYSPYGKILATASNDTVRLYNASTGVHKATLTGHIDAVRSIAYSPDNKILATASNDGTVLLWDITRKAAIKQHGPKSKEI